MTPADAAELLALAAAFDRRTVGEADARAWAAALHAIPLDADARAAVARHYAETDRWLTPAHVRQQRTAIRAERLAVVHVVYDGHPGETGAESAARRRALTSAVASGRLAPQTITRALGLSEDRPALPPGATRAERELFAAERLAALGSYVPRDAAEALRAHRPIRAERESLAEHDRPDALDIACPYEPCHAPVGRPCRNIRLGPGRDAERRTSPRNTPHPSRLDLATHQHAIRRSPASP